MGIIMFISIAFTINGNYKTQKRYYGWMKFLKNFYNVMDLIIVIFYVILIT